MLVGYCSKSESMLDPFPLTSLDHLVDGVIVVPFHPKHAQWVKDRVKLLAMVTNQYFAVSDSQALLAQLGVERCPAEMWRCWTALGWTEWHKAEQFHLDSMYWSVFWRQQPMVFCHVLPPYTITLPPPNDWRWMTQASAYHCPTRRYTRERPSLLSRWN